MVDEDEAFVSDGTGMHPTRTSYATTLVASSLTVGDVAATPTLDTYHRIELSSDVLLFNTHVGDNLVFQDVSKTWSNYNNHVDEYSTATWDDGSTHLHPWVEGFTPRYSWTYTSALTNDVYYNICPTLIYHDGKKTQYYFFLEVFEDFQAVHGWANYSRAKDGLPGADWPGMVKVVRSVAGMSQRPKRRSEYEDWFNTTYGGQFKYAAPNMLSIGRMPLSAPPTRVRYADPSRYTKDEPTPLVLTPPTYRLAEMLDNLPTFTKGTVTLGGQKSFSHGGSNPQRSTPWLKAYIGFSQVGASSSYPSGTANGTLAVAQANTGCNFIVYSPTTYYGVSTTSAWQTGDSNTAVYSGRVKIAATTSIVCWILNTANNPLSGTLVTTGYGYDSTAGPCKDGDGNQTYLLTSADTQNEILSQARIVTSGYYGVIGFVFDATVGSYGQVRWISEI